MPYRISNQTLLSAALLGSLALAGCGGSSSPTADPTPTASKVTTITGSVIDGYIEGANVCLDVNVNQICDADEPKTVTDANGSYKLDTSALTTDQIKAAHLLTVVPDTAKDKDDGGLTLAVAGKKGFSFMAPAAAYVTADGGAVTGAVISPLTTLVSHDMIAGGNVLDTAKSNVRGRLSLPETTDLTQDFVAKNEPVLKAKAQMLTIAIGEVKAQALADTTSKPSDKQAFFAALDYLQNQVAALTKAFDAAKAVNANAKPVALVNTAIATGAAKPEVTKLVAEAKKTETPLASASDLVALLEQGAYNPNRIIDECSFLTPDTSGYCAPTYTKLLGNAGNLTEDDYRLEVGNWRKVTEDNDQNNARLGSSGWRSWSCAAGENITYSAVSDGVFTVKFCHGNSIRVTSRTVDASDKTLSDLGLKTSATFSGTRMPTNSKLDWISFAETEDKYDLVTRNALGKWASVPGQPGVFTEFTTLDNFITAYTQPTGNTPSSQFIMNWDNLAFSFAPGGGLTLFGNPSIAPLPPGSSSPGPTSTGTSTYTRKTVNGVEVLIINAQESENRPGQRVFISVKEGKVYAGRLNLKTAKADTAFFFNKTMINALLVASGKPAVID